MDPKTENIYINLYVQIDKLSRHIRLGSFKTRERYRAGVTRFIRFLAEEYRLQKFANVQPKHIHAYVEYLKESGKSASTVKTDLAAIRFYYDHLPETKGFIPHNDDLELDRRVFGGVDRTWSDEEYSGMVQLARLLGQSRIADVMAIARYAGLRIQEALRLDTASAERALRSGYLHVKGKNGRERDVPMRLEVRLILEGLLKHAVRGEKLFVETDEKTHLVIKQIQNFIVRHRDKVTGPGRESNLTFHGLRHTYAHEEYQSRVSHGMDELRARLEVSELLGHERDDVTRIYLAGSERKDGGK